jgi:hypothetical protein
MFRIRLILGHTVLALLLGRLIGTADDQTPAGIVVDKEKRTITIDAKIAPRKIDDPRYKEIYPIEVIACWPFPKGQKAHETVVTIDVKPSAVHKALEDLGLKAGKPVVGQVKEQARGPEVNIFLAFKSADGQEKKVPIEKTLLDPKTNKKMPKVKWLFTGSVMKKPDPNKDELVYAADLSGTLVAIFPVTDETVFQTPLAFKDQEALRLETDKTLLPKEGQPVKLVIEVPRGK